jgi:hypothetical protein
MPRVVLTGWKPGFRKVEFTKLVQSKTGMPLKDALGQTGRVLNGEVIAFELPTPDEARSFADEARALGATVSFEATRQVPLRA